MSDDGARREAWIAFALGLVYLALMPGHFQSIDGLLVFEQARSLWHEGSLRFADPVVWERAYHTSLYGIGGSLAYLPGVALFSGLEPLRPALGAGLQEWARLYQDPVYALGGNPVQAVATAAGAYATARLGAELGLAPRARLAAMLWLGLASPAFIHSGADFTQPLATALLVGSMVAALRFGRRRAGRALAGCAGLLFCAGLVRPLEAAVIAPFLVLAAGAGGGMPRALRAGVGVGLGLALAALASLAVNAARFGSPFHNEYAALGASFVLSLQGPLALLLSPARGLLFTFPAVWLVPLGLPVRHGDRTDALRTAAVAGFAGALFVVIGSWHMWWGGVAWGPRLLLPALPFLAVLAARGLESLEPRAGRILAVAVFALGFLQALPGVLVDLHGGYGALIADPARGWWLVSTPGLGGWSGLERLLPTGPLDRHALDVYWLRIARDTRFASLAVPVVLLVGAAWSARRALRTAPAEHGFAVRSARWSEDRAQLSEVRFAVFVDEQRVPREIEIDALDEQCEHAIAVDSTGRPIGTARLDATGHIGRVAVLAAWRRRGVGDALMRHLIERARQQGLPRVLLGAQVQAIPFYTSLGFEVCGEVYLEAGIEHRPMQLELDPRGPGA